MTESEAPRMPWGKYRGKPITEVESSYLCWVLDNGSLTKELKDAIYQELGARFARPGRGGMTCPDPQMAAQIVITGRRHLAKKYHPDVGGDHETMMRLNLAVDWLAARIIES